MFFLDMMINSHSLLTSIFITNLLLKFNKEKILFDINNIKNFIFFFKLPMYSFPGENTEILLRNKSPIQIYKYPYLGSKCRAKVLKTTFLQGVLEIFEVENFPSIIKYKAIIKCVEFIPSEYVSHRIKVGDIVEVTVVSYGDLGIYVVL